MGVLLAFTKKEWLEAVRTGKLLILILLFTLFGIMNPAVAKLLPWMMEMFSDTMEETGIIITEMQVDAMTSWMQFFKNIPMALIAFLLLYSDLFTKEYQSGTLLLMLTKGLPRYKAVLAKTGLLFSVWTLCYFLCFAVTYGYNAYFWDNSIANNLFPAAAFWWLFGVWLISLLVLFSSLLQNSAGVVLCIGGSVVMLYLVSFLPWMKSYMPLSLLDSASLLAGMKGAAEYIGSVAVTAILGIVCVAASLFAIGRKNI